MLCYVMFTCVSCTPSSGYLLNVERRCPNPDRMSRAKTYMIVVFAITVTWKE